MNRLEKAKAQLESCGVVTEIDNDTLYVYVTDLMLELADFEIDFRADLYDEELKESN